MKPLLIFLSLTIATPGLAQTPIYVSETTGDDAHQGTNSTSDAVRTLSRAQDLIPSPITGSYEIRVIGRVTAQASSCDATLIWTKSGGNGYAITIKSYNPSNRATIIRSVNSEKSYKSAYLIKLKNAHDVHFDNLMFTDAAAGIVVADSYSCSITNCKFTVGFFEPHSGPGVITIGSDTTDALNIQSHDIIVRQDTIIYTDPRVLDRCWQDEGGSWHCFDLFHGIYIAHADGCIISDNVIKDAPGIGIQANHDYTTNNTISNNKIYMCYNRDYYVWDTKFGVAAHVNNNRHAILFTSVGNGSSTHGNTITNNHIYADQSIDNFRLDDYKAYPLTTDASGTISNSNFLLINNLIGSTSTNCNGNSNCVSSNYFHQRTSGCNSSSAESTAYTARYASRYIGPSPFTGRHIEIFDFVPNDGEMFVVIKESGTILKTTDTVDNKTNMFGTSYASGSYSTGNGVLGVQKFTIPIADIEYTGVYTLIGFTDGRIVKISGTGGTGANMFGTLTPDSGGFNGLSTYFKGSHFFMSGIRDITYVQGSTFISFEDKKMLKLNVSSATGYNVFTLTETATSFSASGNGSDYVGHGLFNGRVTNITYNLGETFISFVMDDNSGKVLKIDGTGLDNGNMFRVSETVSGFTSSPGSTVYKGHAKFIGFVLKMMADNDHHVLLICLSDSKILKVYDNGGTLDNMFKVNETTSNFTKVTGTNWYLGDIKYPDKVGDLLLVNGYTYLALNNGKVYRIPWTGGTGATMFVGYEANNQDFFASVTDIAYIKNKVYLCFANDLILCMNDGATDERMFLTAESPPQITVNPHNGTITNTITDYFINCQYYPSYLYGSQILNYSYPVSYPLGGRLQAPEIATEGQAPEIVTEVQTPEKEKFVVYPNPSPGQITVDFVETGETMISISVYNVNGQRILFEANSTSTPLFIGSHQQGLYIVKVETNKGNYFRKVMLSPK